MLRVGLTGDLGSGKSTVAAMLAARGAVVLSSDEMGRAMMQPGEAVYDEIVRHFGAAVVGEDSALDRRELARMAFGDGRVEELNAIVHPAVLREQARRVEEIAAADAQAIVIVESALIFSTKHTQGSPWRERFDEIVLVTAPEASKVARFVERVSAGRELREEERAALEADARKRLAAQHAEPADIEDCIVVRNNGDVAALERRVEDVWRALVRLGSR